MDILAKNLLILASAGSGKTFQLGNRIIALAARGEKPEHIVALTFTRKAAGEFADSVLNKLAEAASGEDEAARLGRTLGLGDADFRDTLERVVRALPEITLGTMDGFFAKIVRSFQYELGLTGGRFDLLEGPRAAALADELLAAVLGDGLSDAVREPFYHAFRRATIGREDHGVLSALRDFTNRWHWRYREAGQLEWGPELMVNVKPEEWSTRKSALAANAIRGLDQIEYTRSGQREALETAILRLKNHAIGGGSLGKDLSSLLSGILAAVTDPSGPLVVKHYKEFTISGITADAIHEMVELAAHCELAAALHRTRAVREVMAFFDAICDSRLRKKGLLGFNDVKLLMGDWAGSEDARLRRETVDFRLDARIEHWLLDEFQDTSRADWNGLLPLIDEAATSENGSMFVVGDKKQAIYAWRGGDVTLFDEITARYGGGIDIESMAESWRSSPEVLELVNRVCGDSTTMRELFGESAQQWIWENHSPAAYLKLPEKSGHSKVEVVGDWDERMKRLVEILNEAGVGKQAMTCGVLLRGNKQVRDVTDHLRTHGFDVIEEGRREPGKDNPVGIVIHKLLEWLAEPSDPFALEVVRMSPLSGTLLEGHGLSWSKAWESLTATLSKKGLAATVEEIIEDSWSAWSDFGRRRAGDLLFSLADLDSRGGVSANEAAGWIGRLEISQSPGIAAVQVMTIHKSKGLGFDMVVLPEVPDEAVPQPQYFDVAEGEGWLAQTPPKWARILVPELRAAEENWAARQRYEAFCTLYVALTRAKRGLYVLLEPPAKNATPDKPSLSNWMKKSIGTRSESLVIYQTGSTNWANNVPEMENSMIRDRKFSLLAATNQPEYITPTATKFKAAISLQSLGGMKFGNEVHSLLEMVSWTDESLPDWPECDAKRAVIELVSRPALQSVFQKQGRNISLYREQAIDAMVEGCFLSGVMDRLHLHRNAEGSITKLEIIDYKTDAVIDGNELLIHYSGQMNAYRKVLAKIYPGVEILCSLLSVRQGRLYQC